MPKKGRGLITGNRTRLLSRRNPLYRNFVKDTGINIDMNTFKKIIRTTCKKMAESLVSDRDGIQLPEVGYLVVTKYKPKKPCLDRRTSYRIGKDVPFLNLHTFGYIHRIKWYKGGLGMKNSSVYKFRALQKVRIKLYHNLIAGVTFFQWSDSDLWSASSLERRFQKSYKTES